MKTAAATKVLNIIYTNKQNQTRQGVTHFSTPVQMHRQ